MRSEITKNCTLCQGEKIKKIFISHNQHGRHLLDLRDEFDIFTCLECGCVFLGGLSINGEYYKKYYESGYYESANISIFSKLLDLLSRFSARRKQKFILAGLQKYNGISILDVGCGAGGFLLQLDAKKFVKSGAEINPEGAGICRKNGLEIYDQNLIDINFDNKKFDVVAMWHVLEHLPNPVEMFKKIHAILSDNGVLIFEVPNADSFGFRYGREDWFHLDSPRHLILYNIRSVMKLCELSGFRVDRIKNEFYDYPLDLFWSIRKSRIRFLFYPLYPIIKFFSKETLTFICKKI
jgi:2-polyprenyl-3-methyl-5-hydroxy-6-metoxy-1,4-benzoquinol methylase